MSIASVYLKRGVHNYLAKESARIHDWIDHASLFICDEQGKVTSWYLNDWQESADTAEDLWNEFYAVQP